MDWKEIKIYTTHEGVEPVTAMLLELGVGGVSVEDAQDFAEFVETQTPYWDYVDESLGYLQNCETSLTVYLADNDQGAAAYRELIASLARLREADAEGKWGRLKAQEKTVREEDWADSWKQYFKPTPVGERFLIRPTWETLDGVDTAGRRVLTIDPSASFGTGTHHTTRLCIAMLETAVRGGANVLDMGCGSGILGIAAMLLGAGRVTAVDIDENSLRIARENYRQNGIDLSRLTTLCGDINADPALHKAVCGARYDIVAANIVADVIIAMLPALGACLAPDGVMLLSGIIDEREAPVRAALAEQGLALAERRCEGGWVALAARR